MAVGSAALILCRNTEKGTMVTEKEEEDLKLQQSAFRSNELPFLYYFPSFGTIATCHPLF